MTSAKGSVRRHLEKIHLQLDILERQIRALEQLQAMLIGPRGAVADRTPLATMLQEV